MIDSLVEIYRQQDNMEVWKDNRIILPAISYGEGSIQEQVDMFQDRLQKAEIRLGALPPDFNLALDDSNEFRIRKTSASVQDISSRSGVWLIERIRVSAMVH